MGKRLNVSIISPAYNEAKTFPELVKRVNTVMSKTVGSSWEFIVVNDNSTDDSVKVLQKLQKKYKNLQFINHSRNLGQTGAFSTGFKYARGKIIITMDGDLEVDPEDIPLFLQKIKGSVDVVNAIRTNRKHVFAINFVSRIYNLLMYLFFKILTHDSASNFTAFRAHLVRNLQLRHNNDHRYIIPIVQRRGARDIYEVVIGHHFRKAGMSKYTAIKKFFFGFLELLYAWFRIIVLKQYDIKKS